MKAASLLAKPGVAPTCYEESIKYSSSNVPKCSLRDEKFLQLIRRKHCSQLVHYATVLQVSYVVYVSTSETSLIYVVVVFFPTKFVLHYEGVLLKAAGESVNFAYASCPKVSADSNFQTRRTLWDNFPFWTIVNKNIISNRAFSPSRMFKHGFQSV